jgi:hypothetical protein
MRQPSKKRKSFGNNNADNSSTYRPTAKSESSTEDVEAAKPSPPKKRKFGQSRKIQKLQQELIPEAQRSESGLPHDETTAATAPTSGRLIRRVNRDSSKTATSLVASSQLQHKKGHANSPPPSGLFPEPKAPLNTQECRQEIPEDDNFEMIFTAGSSDGHVPPVPKLPKSVRLASGEVIKLETNDAGNKKTSKKTVLKKKARESDSRSKSSFEWPADVF